MSNTKSPLQLISQISSYILHPVFIPTMMVTALVYCCPSLFFGIPDKTSHWWLIIIAYTTVTFPLLVVFLLWRLKFIESMQMHELKERYGPLIASMLFYFWVFWLFHKQFAAPEMIQSFLFGVFLTTVLVFLASIFFKISMHTAGWGGAVGFLLILTLQAVPGALLILLITFLLAGWIGTSRLMLKAHIPAQIYTGYGVGIAMQVLSYFIIHFAFYLS